ncbi:DinB family protein [Flavobacterium soyangense]|uniref:DUF1572 family protein n=1 Tax=Flavobacterium soyangense TaxID=2023265 RepID=A0A930UA30_9FLAO|nr:DinB family protein [Flavobacterium soyangense]MBF2709461.1 DUF1572 family protein [Flavobacterium soyangense]
MLTKTLETLFTRDLNRLKIEIELYQDEKSIWIVDKEISNSAGNICLHIIGNLNTYIGATIGKTNYIRNRELEFSLKDISKSELIKKIEETILVVNNSIRNLNNQDLEAEYPIIVFKDKMSTAFFLVHLATHLSYHLGQINYHRRLLDK